MRPLLGPRTRRALSSSPRRAMKHVVVVGFAYFFVLVAGGMATLAATLPSNIVWERTQLPEVRVELNRLAGQNFAFFTRPPQSEQYGVYRLGSDGAVLESLSVTPQSRAANLLGLSRTQRAQGPEVANLMRALPQDAWVDCSGLDFGPCIDRAGKQPLARLANKSPIRTVCGPVALTIERITKWAYRHLSDKQYTVDRAVSATVDCANGG